MDSELALGVVGGGGGGAAEVVGGGGGGAADDVTTRASEEVGGGGGGETYLGDGTLSNLEYAAKDAISRVLANPDVQNAAESIRAGALKVRVIAI